MNTTSPAVAPLLTPMLYSIFSIAKMELEPGSSSGFPTVSGRSGPHLGENSTCNLPNHLDTVATSLPDGISCQLGQMNGLPYRFLEPDLVSPIMKHVIASKLEGHDDDSGTDEDRREDVEGGLLRHDPRN